MNVASEILLTINLPLNVVRNGHKTDEDAVDALGQQTDSDADPSPSTLKITGLYIRMRFMMIKKNGKRARRVRSQWRAKSRFAWLSAE